MPNFISLVLSRGMPGTLVEFIFSPRNSKPSAVEKAQRGNRSKVTSRSGQGGSVNFGWNTLFR